jgi:neurofibromin 1
MDVGLKHCLTLGYHENPLLRSAFLQLTSSILRTATPFGGLDSQSAQSNLPRPYLDALMADNLAFAVAICEVCPAPEADEMLALLFRSMEAKGTLMNLVKVMIEKEVAQTSK